MSAHIQLLLPGLVAPAAAPVSAPVLAACRLVFVVAVSGGEGEMASAYPLRYPLRGEFYVISNEEQSTRPISILYLWLRVGWRVLFAFFSLSASRLLLAGAPVSPHTTRATKPLGQGADGEASREKALARNLLRSFGGTEPSGQMQKGDRALSAGPMHILPRVLSPRVLLLISGTKKDDRVRIGD